MSLAPAPAGELQNSYIPLDFWRWFFMNAIMQPQGKFWKLLAQHGISIPHRDSWFDLPHRDLLDWLIWRGGKITYGDLWKKLVQHGLKMTQDDFTKWFSEFIVSSKGMFGQIYRELV